MTKETPWLAAKMAGNTTYTSTKPCKKGHGFVRNTANGKCKECANEAQRLRGNVYVDPEKSVVYQKKWNASSKAYQAKLDWKARDPKNAWACSAAGGARARAKKYGVPCIVTKAYIAAITPNSCPIFGQEFVWFGQKLGPFSPSLDRIDPSKGYVPGNVAVISQRANAIKSDANASEIEAVAKWLRAQT